MKNQTNEATVILYASEHNKNSNSIIVQLKEGMQREGYVILPETNNESVLKKVKFDKAIKGIMININAEDMSTAEHFHRKNLLLEIKRTNHSLPIFLIKKNVIISLPPNNERNIIIDTYCQCDKKNINIESLILKTIDNYTNSNQENNPLLPEEHTPYPSTYYALSEKNAAHMKSHTPIENEFIDYFYKKIVEEKPLVTQQKNSSSGKTKTSPTCNSPKKQDCYGYTWPQNESKNHTIHTHSHRGETSVDYFSTMRNSLGLSGLIPAEQFETKSILNILTNNDKKHEMCREINYDIMRTSTADGLIYNINKIIKEIYDAEIKRQFNEEWALFNDYHPFFNGVFSKSILSKMHSLPPLYAAKSVHYILSALSCSTTENNEKYFNTNEKPIALIKTIINAIKFRKAMLKVIYEIKRNDDSDWFFAIWQPSKILFNHTLTSFEDIPDEALTLDAYFWQLTPQDKWHGFNNIAKNYAMLDPTKITLLCPGQCTDGEMTDFGIPAMVVVRFMENKLVMPQKSGNYNFLFDISNDSSPEKWKKIIDILLDFKHAYDTNASLKKTFPTLIKKSPFYTIMGLRDLCEKIHITMTSLNIPALFNQTLSIKKTGIKNQEDIENKKDELISIDNALNKTIAITVSNSDYNPPFLIPGEVITESNKIIIDYLLALQIFEQTFPGFEYPLQGVWRNIHGEYFVKCLIDC
ncbi:hypothetical protein [Rouxiella sp. Mn2063]|uniref:Orn/Lys/Arg family decarboxylase n=1 Tax=Rouxiella sp. Mn2063 TaxID=3395262 RepID=UPI003BCBDA28